MGKKLTDVTREEVIDRLDEQRFNGIDSINESRYKIKRALKLPFRAFSALPSEMMIKIADTLDFIIEDPYKIALGSYNEAKKAEEEYFKIINKPIKNLVEGTFEKFNKIHSYLCENYVDFLKKISIKKDEEFQRMIKPKVKYHEIIMNSK